MENNDHDGQQQTIKRSKDAFDAADGTDGIEGRRGAGNGITPRLTTETMAVATPAALMMTRHSQSQ